MACGELKFTIRPRDGRAASPILRYSVQVMNTSAAASAIDRHAAYNKRRLFLVSILALFTAGLAASLRSAVATDIQKAFLDPIDPIRSETMIGSILGVAFLGFALTIAIGSPLLDKVGMSIM